MRELAAGLSVMDVRSLYEMAGYMLELGNQNDPDGLAAFVRDYPEFAEPAHLRQRAWALSVKWLDELPTRRGRRMREKWAFAARFWAVAFTMTWAAMLVVRFVGTRMLHVDWTAGTLARYVLVSSAVGEMITVVIAWIIYAAVLTMTEQERPDAP